MAAINLSMGAAIVGAAESNEIGYPEERGDKVTSLQHHIQAIKNVSDYTGIPISDIEGVFSTGGRREVIHLQHILMCHGFTSARDPHGARTEAPRNLRSRNDDCATMICHQTAVK